MSAAWPTVPLGDVTRLDLNRESIDPSKTYAMVGVLSFARGLFDREPIENGNTSYKHFLRLKPDHIVMSQLFGWEGALALSDNRFAGKYLSPQFPTFLCDEGRLDRKFLGWLMRRPSFWSDLGTRASGMGDRRRTLNPDAFFACQIPLPSLNEQRRVVARIEKLAAKVEEGRATSAERAAATLALSASVLDMLLPKSAAESPLGELVAPGTSISYGVLVPGPHTSDGIPFVRVQDLSIKSAAESPNKRISLNVAAQYKRTTLSGGEVLVAVVGSIGKVGIAPKSWAGANIARAVCRIVPRPDIDARFLAETLSDRRCQDYFKEQTRTLAQPTLNVRQLEKTPIKLPPLQEQQRIVAELEALQARIDRVKALQAQTAAELDAILPAILDKAFKGEL